MGADTKVTWRTHVKAALITITVIIVFGLLYGWASAASGLSTPPGTICVVPS